MLRDVQASGTHGGGARSCRAPGHPSSRWPRSLGRYHRACPARIGRPGTIAGARTAVTSPIDGRRRAPPARPRAPVSAQAPPRRCWSRSVAAGIVESRHRGHVVQVDADGDVERASATPTTLVTLRSAVKPFALVALVESGAADDVPPVAMPSWRSWPPRTRARTCTCARCRPSSVARASARRCWPAATSGCPLDALTAARLARDGEEPGPIRHMCSGFHAASILLSRHAGWSLDDYWRPDHPSQVAVRDAVARAFGVRPTALRHGRRRLRPRRRTRSRCVEVARAYALLADPAGVAADAARRASARR